MLIRPVVCTQNHGGGSNFDLLLQTERGVICTRDVTVGVMVQLERRWSFESDMVCTLHRTTK